MSCTFDPVGVGVGVGDELLLLPPHAIVKSKLTSTRNGDAQNSNVRPVSLTMRFTAVIGPPPRSRPAAPSQEHTLVPQMTAYARPIPPPTQAAQSSTDVVPPASSPALGRP